MSRWSGPIAAIYDCIFFSPLAEKAAAALKRRRANIFGFLAISMVWGFVKMTRGCKERNLGKRLLPKTSSYACFFGVCVLILANLMMIICEASSIGQSLVRKKNVLLSSGRIELVLQIILEIFVYVQILGPFGLILNILNILNLNIDNLIWNNTSLIAMHFFKSLTWNGSSKYSSFTFKNCIYYFLLARWRCSLEN